VDSKTAIFQFAGKGACSAIVNAASKKNADQITFVGSYDREDQWRILGDCDIGIVTLAPGMYGLGVPSKAYNIMAAGKPILYIGDVNSELDRVLKEHQCGWAVNYSDPEKISETINKICSESLQTIREKGRNARRLGNDVYTLGNSIRKYDDVLGGEK